MVCHHSVNFASKPRVDLLKLLRRVHSPDHNSDSSGSQMFVQVLLVLEHHVKQPKQKPFKSCQSVGLSHFDDDLCIFEVGDDGRVVVVISERQQPQQANVVQKHHFEALTGIHASAHFHVGRRQELRMLPRTRRNPKYSMFHSMFLHQQIHQS